MSNERQAISSKPQTQRKSRVYPKVLMLATQGLLYHILISMSLHNTKKKCKQTYTIVNSSSEDNERHSKSVVTMEVDIEDSDKELGKHMKWNIGKEN